MQLDTKIKESRTDSSHGKIISRLRDFEIKVAKKDNKLIKIGDIDPELLSITYVKCFKI